MRTRWHILAPLFILLAGVVTFASSFDGVFILDDAGWLKENLESGSLASHIQQSTRPLVGLSFYFNYRVSGTTAADYHAVNLLIHLMAGLLLYGILRRTLALPGVSTLATRAHLLPVFAAMIWTVHPLQTESVTYIVQRAESLMSLFFLLTLYGMIRAATVPRGVGWSVLAVVACALGMLTKPIMVTAPLVMLLYDRTFLSGSCRSAWRERRGLYAGLAASWAILAWLVLSPNESSATTGLSVDAVTPLGYLATQAGVIVHYLKLIVWPHRLCLDLAWPPAAGLREVWLPGLGVCTLIVAATVLTWRRSATGFCLAWFFIILAPSSSIVSIADFAVEHRLYLALAGPAVLAVNGVLALVHGGLRRIKSERVVLAASAVVLMVLTLGLAIRTDLRNRDYRSQEAIAHSTVTVSPHNFRARVLWLDALLAEQQVERVEQEARRLIADTERVMDSSLPRYTISACVPGYYRPVAYTRLGRALLRLDRTEEALAAYETSLRWRPDDESACYGRAVALLGLGRHEEALAAADRGLALNPRDGSLYALKGMILIRGGRAGDAVPWLEEAMARDPSDAMARLELAWLLATDADASVRDGERARVLVEAVARLTGGGNARTADAMAAAQAACGNFGAAIEWGESALSAAESQLLEGGGTAGDRGAVPSTPQAIEARLARYRAGAMWFREGNTPRIEEVEGHE